MVLSAMDLVKAPKPVDELVEVLRSPLETAPVTGTKTAPSLARKLRSKSRLAMALASHLVDRFVPGPRPLDVRPLTARLPPSFPFKRVMVLSVATPVSLQCRGETHSATVLED